jgi:phosphoglycolate phosphatase-like HAD superfamily hydrolase
MGEATPLPRPCAYGFDWSGTLCDDLELAYGVSKQLCGQLGMPIEASAEECGRHPACNPIDDFKSRSRCKPPIAPETFAHLYSERYATAGTETPPRLFPGVAAALLAAKKRRPSRIFFIVSACPWLVINDVVEEAGLSEVFRSLIYSTSDGKTTKAHVIRTLIRQLDLYQQECVYVGDTIGDCQAAKQAGIGFVGVRGYHTKEMLFDAGAHFVCDSAAELLERST